MKHRYALLLAVIALSAAGVGGWVLVAEGGAPPATPVKEAASPRALANQSLFEELLDVVNEGFYDKNLNGIKLDTFRANWRDRVASSQGGDALLGVMRESLKQFKASHLTVMRGDVYWRFYRPEMNNATSLQYGVDLMPQDGKLFVADAVISGAALASGVKTGDEVVTIDGEPAFTSPRLLDGGSDALFDTHYILMPPLTNDAVTLGVRRTHDGTVENIRVEPKAMSLIKATEASVSVIERNGRTYGYIRIYHFLHGEVAHIFARAVEGKWRGTDGLIIDLRGRGGSPETMNTVLRMATGKGMQEERRRPRRDAKEWPRYEGAPIVGLIDGSSRSAKEVFAYNFKQTGGCLVGKPTAGAVLASTFVALSDGTRVLLPVSDPREIVHGKTRLEGNPVKPDVVTDIVTTYTAGRDDLLDAGCKTLDGKMDAKKPSRYKEIQEELKSGGGSKHKEEEF